MKLIKKLDLKKVLLIAALLLSFALRVYKLDEYPALNADEAAIGYNAYSLLTTGLDEHGNSWPIHFQSFNDYKPGLYFYLVLPFVKFIGLNPWAIRLPSALLGVATVYLVYLLGKELFKNGFKFGNWDLEIGILASFMLAVSPWHIHFSRGGWEVNVSTFLITLGVLFYLKFINAKKATHLMFSVVSFSLSLYTYHASRIIVPLLGMSLLIIFWEDLKNNFRTYIIAAILGIILLTPLIVDFTRPETISRAAGVGIFRDPGIVSRINEQRGEHGNVVNVIGMTFHNKPVNFALEFMQNWMDHFNGEFLFVSGEEIQRNKVPETGQMYLLDMLWIAIGLWWVAKMTIKNKNVQVLIAWLLIAPIPAAFTFQSPHALRAQNMVIPLIIISSLGLMRTVNWIKDNLKNKYVLTTYYILLTAIMVCQFGRYLHMYWVHMAKQYPFSSQYGMRELAEYLKENSKDYDKIVISDRYDQPYIMLLYYLSYPPSQFQNAHELTPPDQFGFSTVVNFDKFVFKKIDWDNDVNNYKGSIIAGTDEEIPDGTNIVKEIYGSNGYLYFQIVEN